MDVTTWYLEMLDLRELIHPRAACLNISMEQAKIPCPEFSRFLYTSVGGDWHWTDRLAWNFDQWLKHMDRTEVQTWVAYSQGTPAGYVELELQDDDNVEVAYFGLLRQFIGRGIGGNLLSFGVQKAWEAGAKRVWVHTCSLDGSTALANYLARGFKLFKQSTHQREIPSKPVGPWNGAFPPRT
ncbi:MAG: GNAT family N-acetyltransferase [Pseudobdellovibrionaceae bacterium]|nr:GNAT family N-acetyltransferase [Pseudobdellovibrionaceae bacterium]